MGIVQIYNKMRVVKLRKMLDEKGLDVDGSRESMIALLKERSYNEHMNMILHGEMGVR